MVSKCFGVLGLGKFGGAVARELSNMGCDVIAVDRDAEVVKNLAMDVSYAVTADVTDITALKEIGISDTDAVFISISEDLESSILAALVVKDLGVKHIIAKASSRLHGTVLEKVGVDRVVYPEREMGIRVAKNVVAGNFLDMMDLSAEYSIVEIMLPQKWIGNTLSGLDVRRNYGLNIVAIKRDDGVLVNMGPNEELQQDDVLIVIGSNTSIAELGNS